MTPKTLSKSQTRPQTRRSGTAGRRAVRALAPAVAMLTLLVAAPAAVADVPEGWSQPDDVTAWQFLLVLLVLPLAAVAVIAFLVYLPALVRGEKVTPGAEVEDQWIGGPRKDKAELAGGQSQETGGASGRW